MEDHPEPKAEPIGEAAVPTRLIGETAYGLLISAPRFIAEGLKARLEEAKIPVHLETPFTQFGLGDFYMGTYTGDVSLWVPQSFYAEAELIMGRDEDGETL